MALPDLDRAVGWSFGLEIDGIQVKEIQEISGLKMEQDVIELKHNSSADGKYVNKKMPGRAKAGEFTVTRGLSDDSSFEKLIKDARLGNMGSARKNGAVVVYDYQGAAIKRYKITALWAKSLEIGSLKAGGTDVLTEKLTLTYETMEVE
ncbi:phage tail protein [Fodinicola feengrottensis]|uniref:Phage tail protein n=1 Tax=Fodinicola feengrottensis TaxID=435914 RepID=A0ABN2FVY8_9ACTN|nr:phage tail protein [Fodinicola feengrottensis]